MAAQAGSRRAASETAAASGEFRFARRRAAVILVALGVLVGWVLAYYLTARGIQDGADAALVLVACLLLVAWGVLSYEYLKAGRLILGAQELTIRRGFSRLSLPWSSVKSIDRVLVAPEREDIRESRAGPAGFDETMGAPGTGWMLVYELRAQSASDIVRTGLLSLFRRRPVVRIAPRWVTEPAFLTAALEGRRLAMQPWTRQAATADGPPSTLEPMSADPMPVGFSDEESSMALGEARDLVARFEALRRVYRGRLAAPVTELPADPETMTRALLTVAATLDETQQRRITEALMDLVAFIDPADADLLDARARGSQADAERTQALLQTIRATRARLIQQIRQDSSAVGDFGLLGDQPTPIGKARAALERVREGQEGQMVAMLSAVLVLIVTGVAYASGSWWWLAFLVGCVASGVGAVGMARIGRWLDRGLSLLENPRGPVSRRRINVVRELVVLVGGLAIPLIAMAAVIGLTD